MMASLWHGTRQERHEALDTVFRELGCHTLGPRMRAWRELARIADRYEQQKRMNEGFDRKKQRKWLEDVNSTATHLTGLLESNPSPQATDFVLRRMLGNMERDPKLLIADLRAVASAAANPQTIPGAHWKGGKRESAFNGLIRDLAMLYQLTAQNEAARATQHDTRYTFYNAAPSPRHGKPAGPFFRFVAAVLSLIGEKRTGHQIDGAIRRHAGSPFKTMDKSID